MKNDLNTQAPLILNGLDFALSLKLDFKVYSKLVGESDLDALVETDRLCFEDLYYDKEEFLQEIKNESFYGIIAYNLNDLETPVFNNSFANIIGHKDVDYIDSPAPAPISELKGNGAYIATCAVMPDIQRKGIFKKVLEYYESITKLQDLDYIRLHSRTKDNPESNEEINVFEKCGFKITGEIKDHYDKGDHVNEMVKYLS